MLIVGDKGTRQQRVSSGKADDNDVTITSELSLDPDRRLSGKTITTATGEFADTLRGYLVRKERSGSGEMLSTWQKDSNMPGKADAWIGKTVGVDDGMTMKGSVDGATSDPIDETIFTPPSGLSAFSAWPAWLIGSKPVLPRVGGMHCRPGQIKEDITVRLPKGVTLPALPKPVAFDKGGLSFQSSWTMEGGALVIHRQLRVSVDTRACPASMATNFLALWRAVTPEFKRHLTLENWPEQAG